MSNTTASKASRRLRIGGSKQADGLTPEEEQQLRRQASDEAFAAKVEAEFLALLGSYHQASDPLGQLRTLLEPARRISLVHEPQGLEANLVKALVMIAVYLVAGPEAYWTIRCWLWPRQRDRSATRWQQTAVVLIVTVFRAECPSIAAVFNPARKEGEPPLDPMALLESAASVLRGDGAWISAYSIRRCLQYVQEKHVETHEELRDDLTLRCRRPRTYEDELRILVKRFSDAAPEQQAAMAKQLTTKLPQVAAVAQTVDSSPATPLEASEGTPDKENVSLKGGCEPGPAASLVGKIAGPNGPAAPAGGTASWEELLSQSQKMLTTAGSEQVGKVKALRRLGSEALSFCERLALISAELLELGSECLIPGGQETLQALSREVDKAVYQLEETDALCGHQGRC